MYTKKQLLAALHDAENESDLLKIIRETRLEGDLSQLSQDMTDLVFSEPELWDRVSSSLEGLVFGGLETNVSNASPQENRELPPSGQGTSDPVPQKTTAQALRWTSEMLEDELTEAGDTECANQRRHALWQIQSVLKYALGDPMGLLELAQYAEDDITPVTRWMMVAVDQMGDRPTPSQDAGMLPRPRGVGP